MILGVPGGQLGEALPGSEAGPGARSRPSQGCGGARLAEVGIVHKVRVFCKDSMTSKALGAQWVLFCDSHTLPTEPRGPVASAGLSCLLAVWGLPPARPV